MTYADRVVSPYGPQAMRDIRRHARGTLGRLVRYPELLAMVCAAQRNDAAEDRRIAEAAGAVMETLRASRLVAHGQPSLANGDHDRSAARTAAGYPVASATLATKATRGGGGGSVQRRDGGWASAANS